MDRGRATQGGQGGNGFSGRGRLGEQSFLSRALCRGTVYMGDYSRSYPWPELRRLPQRGNLVREAVEARAHTGRRLRAAREP